MIILDTNVLSALMLQDPDPRVITWLDRQPRISLWTTSVTVFEVLFGLQSLGAGRRRSMLIESFEKALKGLEHRVAGFDNEAAWQAADLMAARQRKGQVRDIRDTMIAGIVLARHATLVTGNTRDFEDLPVPVVNPWAA